MSLTSSRTTTKTAMKRAKIRRIPCLSWTEFLASPGLLRRVRRKSGVDRPRSRGVKDQRGGSSALADDGPLGRSRVPLGDGSGKLPPSLGRGRRGARGVGRLPGRDPTAYSSPAHGPTESTAGASTAKWSLRPGAPEGSAVRSEQQRPSPERRFGSPRETR